MPYRIPPPIVYQNQDATRAAARKDYGDRYRLGDAILSTIGGGARVASWPVRTLWRHLRPIR